MKRYQKQLPQNSRQKHSSSPTQSKKFKNHPQEAGSEKSRTRTFATWSLIYRQKQTNMDYRCMSVAVYVCCPRRKATLDHFSNFLKSLKERKARILTQVETGSQRRNSTQLHHHFTIAPRQGRQDGALRFRQGHVNAFHLGNDLFDRWTDFQPSINRCPDPVPISSAFLLLVL